MQSVIAFATVLTQNQTIKGLNLNRPILYGEQVCILSEQLIMLYVNKTKVLTEGYVKVHECTVFLELLTTIYK